MGLCSGSGFLHAIEGQGNASLRRQVILRHHHERRRNITAPHKSEYYPEGDGSDLSCSYATSIFKLCEINALQTTFLMFLMSMNHDA